MNDPLKIIRFQKLRGWKYRLHEPYAIQTDIKPNHNISTDYISFSTDGVLVLSKGYAWDGASGPCIDTADVMRGSLCHDALYQLMRLGFLDRSYRQPADRLLQRLCLEDGVCRFRAAYIYLAVHWFATSATLQRTDNPIYEAPK